MGHMAQRCPQMTQNACTVFAADMALPAFPSNFVWTAVHEGSGTVSSSFTPQAQCIHEVQILYKQPHDYVHRLKQGHFNTLLILDCL